MKIFMSIAAGMLLFSMGCKKNNPTNPPEAEKPLGPFNIYSSLLCNDNGFALVNHTGKKKVVATIEKNPELASPEFYLKKSGNGYIVYILQRIGNDSTFWVWAASPDEFECPPCKTGTGVDIALETFKKLEDVSGNKYIFSFNPNGNATTLQVPGGAYVFYGDGIERATKTCNRYMSMIISGNDPSGYTKAMNEGEKIWDYSFRSDWFFKKKG
ncbi:MAG: hypothetical protein J0I84_14465 [Terrimonas sp.]|nr:hypothetical protein [Terrimonas sp.]